ncbi:GNAT family N-acetyltransferase [Hydrogenovibrio crunogenus]|uniref:GNAT family N-acetyltransferase n=1 Tax=Hydrogenovibrio crunogenus TaxID=39765 RepID=A0A4P7P0U7_9GAMM|nr:GNAT family N-acetyltransferase [Hydrogenovibrio crunogenus]QBZ83707.1 GNAT family N-acetyltransferase [Hydrogenovibrio crunogenus]
MIEKITRVISTDDVLRISELHKKNYPDGHLTKYFSKSFLSVYYSYFLHRGCTLVVDRNLDGEIDGFVLAGKNLADLIREFKKDFKLLIIKESLLNIRQALQSFLLKFKSLLTSSKSIDEAEFLILSIVSDDNTKGVGSRVISALISESAGQDLGLYVKVSNIKAINFYLRHGFSIKNYISGQFYMELSGIV